MNKTSPDMQSSLVADGWTLLTDDGFIGLVGPFFQKGESPNLKFCFPVEDRHHNLRGVAQGGVMMTFADRIMGIAARAGTKSLRTATVQFNFQFVDAVQIGETIHASPVIVRGTKQLIFMNAVLMVDQRTVGVASGVWKRLAPPAAK